MRYHFIILQLCLFLTFSITIITEHDYHYNKNYINSLFPIDSNQWHDILSVLAWVRVSACWHQFLTSTNIDGNSFTFIAVQFQFKIQGITCVNILMFHVRMSCFWRFVNISQKGKEKKQVKIKNTSRDDGYLPKVHSHDLCLRSDSVYYFFHYSFSIKNKIMLIALPARNDTNQTCSDLPNSDLPI